jgi:hypothetical protein
MIPSPYKNEPLPEEYCPPQTAQEAQYSRLHRLVLFPKMATAAKTGFSIFGQVRVLPAAGRAAIADYKMDLTDVRAGVSLGTFCAYAPGIHVRPEAAAGILDLAMNDLCVNIRVCRRADGLGVIDLVLHLTIGSGELYADRLPSRRDAAVLR